MKIAKSTKQTYVEIHKCVESLEKLWQKYGWRNIESEERKEMDKTQTG